MQNTESSKPSPATISVQQTFPADQEPMAQLHSSLCDLLNKEVFEVLPLRSKARLLRFISDSYEDVEP